MCKRGGKNTKRCQENFIAVTNRCLKKPFLLFKQTKYEKNISQQGGKKEFFSHLDEKILATFSISDLNFNKLWIRVVCLSMRLQSYITEQFWNTMKSLTLLSTFFALLETFEKFPSICEWRRLDVCELTFKLFFDKSYLSFPDIRTIYGCLPFF